MPCCWPQEGAAGSRSSRAPRKLPLTNFQASWGQSATMLKHLAIFLCYAGGAAALAFYGPQWLPEGLPLADRESAVGLGLAVLLAGGLLHEVWARLGREAFLARSEEHTSELQSLMRISYAVFCLKKKKKK